MGPARPGMGAHATVRGQVIRHLKSEHGFQVGGIAKAKGGDAEDG